MKKDFELVYESGPHGDQCYSYDIKFNKPVTLQEFLIQLNPEEWGDIEVRTIDLTEVSGYKKIKIQYRNGNVTKSSPFIDLYTDKIIKSGNAYGGWSHMTYFLELCQN